MGSGYIYLCWLLFQSCNFMLACGFVWPWEKAEWKFWIDQNYILPKKGEVLAWISWQKEKTLKEQDRFFFDTWLLLAWSVSETMSLSVGWTTHQRNGFTALSLFLSMPSKLIKLFSRFNLIYRVLNATGDLMNDRKLLRKKKKKAKTLRMIFF